MQYLVATDSARTTAAACDYLEDRISAADGVLLLAVSETDQSIDHGGALEAATDRLSVASVETMVREGEPAVNVRALVDERGIDEVVIGRRRDEGTAGLGGTASTVLVEASVPVVVLPTP